MLGSTSYWELQEMQLIADNWQLNISSDPKARESEIQKSHRVSTHPSGNPEGFNSLRPTLGLDLGLERFPLAASFTV